MVFGGSSVPHPSLCEEWGTLLGGRSDGGETAGEVLRAGWDWPRYLLDATSAGFASALDCSHRVPRDDGEAATRGARHKDPEGELLMTARHPQITRARDNPGPQSIAPPIPRWDRSQPSGPARWQSELMSRQKGLNHAFTGAGDNLSPTKGPDCEHSQQRREALCDWLGVGHDGVITAQQVHGTHVVAVDDAQSATGADGMPTCVPNVDGLVTNRPGRALMALSADCPLVLVYDPAGCAFGLAHAGWRGTLGGIAERLVACLTSNYGSAAAQMVATICPSAGPCCYEVGTDVVDMATERWPEGDRFLVRCDGHMLLDLWSANAAQLQNAGLAPERIETPGLCSICDDRFHSYRRAGAATGHSGLIAAMTR